MLIILIYILIFNIYIIFWSTRNEAFIDKYFKVKKFLDILIFLLHFFAAVYLVLFSEGKIQQIWLCFLVALSLMNQVWLLIVNTRGLVEDLGHIGTSFTKKDFKDVIFPIALNYFTLIIVGFSMINFYIYFFIENSFENVNATSWFTLAFDFLYYSFLTSITFSGGAIVPNSILTKLISMIQIVVFYFIIGELIFKIINIYRDKNN